MSIRPMLALGAAGALGASLLLGAPTAAAHGNSHANKTTVVKGKISELNNSGVSGRAHVRVKRNNIHVKYRASGLVAGMPHAVHIHHSEEALHECPTLARFDDNNDGKLSTVEGVPAYGAVAVSLTTRGDTSPDSVLAIDRFPTAPNGSIKYKRKNIKVSADLANDIAEGEGVIVIHGVDYNGNGVYDAEAGMSELDPSLPREATDPAACGVLR